MIWLFSTYYFEPDEWVHENSKNFDDDRFFFVAKYMPKKHALSRPLETGEPPRTYTVDRLAFNLNEVGVPASRSRSWRIGRLNNINQSLLKPGTFVDMFERVFFRKLVLDCSVYRLGQSAEADGIFASHQRQWLKDRGEEWQLAAVEESCRAEAAEADSMSLGCDSQPVSDEEGEFENTRSRLNKMARELGPFCTPLFKSRYDICRDMLREIVVWLKAYRYRQGYPEYRQPDYQWHGSRVRRAAGRFIFIQIPNGPGPPDRRRRLRRRYHRYRRRRRRPPTQPLPPPPPPALAGDRLHHANDPQRGRVVAVVDLQLPCLTTRFAFNSDKGKIMIQIS